jgi:dTDP-glucose pyrophosphorylase
MDKGDEHNWKNVLISVNMTVISAIKQMDAEAWRVLLVVDDTQRLLGVITDGDIRRYLLKQGSFEASVEQVMNKNPVTASVLENQDHLLMRMHSLRILHLPIVDDENRVVRLETFDTIFAKSTQDNWVIFMAGGMGKRLYPLTIDCPKPLLKVGSKPISEILLDNFIKCGFKNFYFSVNYKSDMIRDYYGSGERWGIQIEYIEENAALGTAGSLSLLPSKPDKPFFVVNADILTNINFCHVLEFHQENKSKVHATLCMRQYYNTIPYGLVHYDEKHQRLVNIEEKPTKSFFVSAGIYVLEPEVLEFLPFNSYCDMPNLLTNLVQQDLHVATFPICEYWLDIGHHDDLAKASTDYLEVFS